MKYLIGILFLIVWFMCLNAFCDGDFVFYEKATIYHRCYECHGKAFIWREIPRLGDIISASMACHLNGENFEPGDEIMCGSCNKHLNPMLFRKTDIFIEKKRVLL
jgi:hypothetical protein